jgi:hypothetical protein
MCSDYDVSPFVWKILYIQKACMLRSVCGIVRVTTISIANGPRLNMEQEQLVSAVRRQK